jgi:glutaredoxin 3
VVVCLISKYTIMDRVTKLASQRAVVIFSASSCCMCHTVTRLFRELGVNPTVVELDEDPSWGKEMEKALARLLGRSPAVPAVFIGGRLVGSTDKVMSLHLSGNLDTMLRNAGALWV